MIRTIHPFPARMAPEIALEKLRHLPPSRVVLDPMAGSGTVLRQATSLGHIAIGFDVDPLAVLMARVWTSPVDDLLVAETATRVLSRIGALNPDEAALPWIDDDAETSAFVNSWFARPQRNDLRRIAYVLNQMAQEDADTNVARVLDVLRLSLSRIIITKDRGASLARDVSHSRPHKIAGPNDFAVIPMFERSINAVRKRLRDAPPAGHASISLGDARCLSGLGDSSVDAVLTSPPYLNAIDYMRGHRMSLVWLGHHVAELRTIRSDSIGAERSPKQAISGADLLAMRGEMGEIDRLPPRFSKIVDRYIQDIREFVSEISRVLRPNGTATFVMGNSCLRGLFVRNSAAVSAAARFSGLSLTEERERYLPPRNRYLPMTSPSLGKRMSTETILRYSKA